MSDKFHPPASALPPRRDVVCSYDDGARSTLVEPVDSARRIRRRHSRPTHGWDALTPAELAVAREIANGHTNTQAAERLFIASSTVKTHLERTYAKLNIHSRAALATQVARHDREHAANYVPHSAPPPR